MTTFLRAHSWLNWVDEDDDEDEAGLKETPLDKSKRLHRNKTRSTGSVDKGLKLTWSQFIAIIGIADSDKCRYVRQAWGYLWGCEMS